MSVIGPSAIRWCIVLIPSSYPEAASESSTTGPFKYYFYSLTLTTLSNTDPYYDNSNIFKTHSTKTHSYIHTRPNTKSIYHHKNGTNCLPA